MIPQYPFDRRLGGFQFRFRPLRRREKFLDLPGVEPLRCIP
jgi:hypothetical protein